MALSYLKQGNFYYLATELFRTNRKQTKEDWILVFQTVCNRLFSWLRGELA